MGNCVCTCNKNDFSKQKVLYVNMYERPRYDKSLPSIKLLFLDVDGVLCSSVNGMQNEYYRNLKTIIEKTDCKIVVSSTWRLNPRHRSQLVNAISKRCGYTMEQLNELIIGDTPDLEYGEDPMQSRGMEIKFSRAHEIDSFLRSKAIVSKYNVISWVALDDAELDAKKLNYYESEIMNGHFVHTNPLKCLIKSDANKAIEILNGIDSNTN